MKDFDSALAKAVQFFWTTRESQGKNQGAKSGQKDAGYRSAVTGGKQMDGLIRLVSEIVCKEGCQREHIFLDKRLELPGFFRPTKKWDLVIVQDGNLLAAMEFKSHIGPSFGNNYNNRTEEALGNATDILAAYREGTFKPSPKPWLGYIMLLEDSKKSTQAVKVDEPHFKVRDEFRGASYATRYELLCEKLVREQLYDAACLILSPRGTSGVYSEPNSELDFKRFISSLTGAISGHLRAGK